jgi:hypothetical protein
MWDFRYAAAVVSHSTHPNPRRASAAPSCDSHQAWRLPPVPLCPAEPAPPADPASVQLVASPPAVDSLQPPPPLVTTMTVWKPSRLPVSAKGGFQNHLTLSLGALWWCACSIAAVYLLDANFVNDGSKFIAGTMQALSAMTMLEVPHVNVRTRPTALLRTCPAAPALVVVVAQSDLSRSLALTLSAHCTAHGTDAGMDGSVQVLTKMDLVRNKKQIHSCVCSPHNTRLIIHQPFEPAYSCSHALGLRCDGSRSCGVYVCGSLFHL